MSWRDFNNAIDALVESENDITRRLRFELCWLYNSKQTKSHHQIDPWDVIWMEGDPVKGVPSGDMHTMVELAKKCGYRIPDNMTGYEYN